MRQLSELGIDAASSADVVRLVMQGQPEAIRLIRDAGRLLGEVLASAVALLNPAVLVLGGSLSGCGDYLLDAVRQEIFARTVHLATQELTIATSTLGGDAAVQGARHLVIDQTFSADAVDARLASHQ